jgi:hypothetical protein
MGDAFRLPSRDFDYDRDFFLLWPFLMSTILGLVKLFTPARAQTVLGMKCLARSALAICHSIGSRATHPISGALGFCAI